MCFKQRRENGISHSIHRALTIEPDCEGKHQHGCTENVLYFFLIWELRLVRISSQLFRNLRDEVWKIDEAAYSASFRYDKKYGGLVPMGDLGYSGSTFFRTADSKYLVKSLPRKAEHDFFKEELLSPYCEYMSANPDSLLVHITDFLGTSSPTLGTLFGWSPSHHVIMENVLCDRDEASELDKWETYDLKPVDYFYPERDLVPEPLTSRTVMSRLYDEFKDKVRITKSQFQYLRERCDRDSDLLKHSNTVDYSLFLVRYPSGLEPSMPIQTASEWRKGVMSADGRWIYRAVLLDFFWAKHKLPAQALTGVVQTFNVVGRKGPMSITTTASEYKEKFMQMVDGLVELHGD
ncbi:hypothetical protein BGW36DRAFT_433122 [Talaromyces proteolyticus]|uniref:PIPK domain-containing protein n=1 Tax=Talaromyces proteolyticus TaxID=1131652 RepID=A0AAD4KIJ8_9EURO|nr:uncharacterized protein BGW36DRAFT_433122 [Talaromyces proteolyticus]KAH8690170.1 hypothetical protein BGW36DRAFT_433122 [Talaromyces proteolyticus]